MAISSNELSFEDFKQENGHTFWWASDLQLMLDYSSWQSFQKVINKAVRLFASVEIPFDEHITSVERIDDNGSPFKDYKLTRFACLVIVMQADSKKESVAQAQLLLAGQARLLQEAVASNSIDLERLVIREDIKDGNASLSSVLKRYGGFDDPRDYAIFHNAGYMGMYNMSRKELLKRRGIADSKKIFDTMGRAELAANLFRITQTEERIKTRGEKTLREMSKTHTEVGRNVRNFVLENSGVAPENMTQEFPLPAIKRELKQAKTTIQKLDKKK